MSTPDKVGLGCNGQNKRNDRGGHIVPKREKFNSRTEELSRYVFDITSAHNSNQYARVLKEVACHLGSTSKFGADLKKTIEAEKIFNILIPTCPPAPTTTATQREINENAVLMDIYCKDVKNYAKQLNVLEDNMVERTKSSGDSVPPRCA